jgi:uncharacterized protein (TIGR03437 family)
MFASGTQINFQVPWDFKTGPVQFDADKLSHIPNQTQTVTVVPFAPGLFSINGKGTGQGAILNAQNQLVDANHPAQSGDIIQIYCTGLGSVANQPKTGFPALSNPLSQTLATPSVTVGGVPATVLFSGLAPGVAGLNQVNVRVPNSVPPGTGVKVVLSIGGVTSNTVTIAAGPPPLTIKYQFSGTTPLQSWFDNPDRAIPDAVPFTGTLEFDSTQTPTSVPKDGGTQWTYTYNNLSITSQNQTMSVGPGTMNVFTKITSNPSAYDPPVGESLFVNFSDVRIDSSGQVVGCNNGSVCIPTDGTNRTGLFGVSFDWFGLALLDQSASTLSNPPSLTNLSIANFDRAAVQLQRTYNITLLWITSLNQVNP